MKKAIFFFFLFSVFILFSQENTIKNALKQKPDNYFKLKEILPDFRKQPIDSLKKLNDLSEKANYKVGQIYALHLIGLLYKEKSEYGIALNAIEEALEIADNRKDITSKIVLYNSLGSLYRRQYDVKNAISYHQDALTEAYKIKDLSDENKRSISIAENSIGNIYLILKQYDLALEQFKKALKVQEELNDIHGIAVNYQNIGYTYEKLRDIDKALENYETSLKYNIQNNSKIGQTICYNNICGVLLQKNQLIEALQIAKGNLEEAKRLKDKYYYSQAINTLGAAYLKNKNLQKAETTLKESLKIAKKYGYKKEEIETSFLLSELYEKLNNNKEAFEYYKNAIKEDLKTSGEQNLLFVNKLINKHSTQIKLNRLKQIENQNKIQTYEISKSRNVLIITLVSLALLSVALYSIYRQRLLNNDRRVLLLEQQALQAQMNPHFIFNALNSIKLYIINNDQKQAVYYLNKFSKLIRNILDVSKIKEVSLEEELKTMDLYMSIENIRFNNEIKYTQKINSNLSLDTIKVPPLVLQPFLENAIWHGLSSKKDDKEIILSAFKVSKNLIEISIADNGVGRQAATKIKRSKSLKRKSIGIDLTKERLKTFSEDFMNDFSLKYYDLTDDNGNPRGTKVTLRIPLT